MRPRHLFLIIAAMCFVFVGCEGDEGPQGPPGPPGPSGADSEFTFVGKQGEPCQHCHLNVVEEWTLTGHATATSDLDVADQDNPYCMQCHTTGWDRTFTFGQDFDAVEPGPDTEGYDDYFRVDTEEAAERRMQLAGVQCEACHGAMGPDFNAHRPEVSFSTHDDPQTGESTSLCSPCHSNQLDEWATSGHAFYEEGVGPGDIDEFNMEHYVNRSSCDYCHTSEGFIRENDPAYANYDFPEEQSFIGCVTCHDPHMGADGGGNPGQLRTVRSVEVEYHPGYEDGDIEVARLEGKGGGQMCAQCHHARRDTENVQGQIANGYGHFGPHSSPQMDMYLGAGSYEIDGYTYAGRYDVDAATHYSALDNSCVSCHMAFTEDGPVHRLHNFEPNLALGCGCHGNDEATVAAFLTNYVDNTITPKMDAVAQALGYADHVAFEATIDDDNLNMTVVEREAAYALVFVLSDGSEGVHNPKYAEALLDNALDYLNSQLAK